MRDWLAARLERLTARAAGVPPVPAEGAPDAPGQTATAPSNAPPAPRAALEAAAPPAPPASVSPADRKQAQARFALGVACLGRKDAAGALGHFLAALALDPAHADAQANAGAVLREQGDAARAMPHLEAALALQPRHPEAAYNLAMLRIDARRWRDAQTLLERYTAVRPGDADGHYWLGNARMGQGDAVAARHAYQQAVRQRATHVQARWGLAMAQLPALPLDAAEAESAPAAFADQLGALERWFSSRKPADGFRAVGAQQPFYLAYRGGDHRALLSRYGDLCQGAMAAWGRTVGVPAPAARGSGALRVGIVSAHIHSHSVWHAIVRGWLAHLEPRAVALQVFHTGALRDAQTDWASSRARLHHGTRDWSAWAKLIADARLDVLLYPEIGMDATTVRLSALRLARVQLASWGHPITTGLPTIDGYLSAEAFEPAGANAHYREELVALPRLGCAYQPYGTTPARPDRAALGLPATGSLLLCAGAAFKYDPRDDGLWVDVARRCAPCTLVFFRGDGDPKAAMLEARLRAAFTAGGLDFDASVRFVPWQSQAGFFGLLQAADVFLDTAGFSGFNTAMQAVECGTPIVAWEGDALRGRFASGILRQLGLDDWVATDHAGYAQRVHRLCADADARRAVRSRLAADRAGLYGDRAGVAALGTVLQDFAAR